MRRLGLVSTFVFALACGKAGETSGPTGPSTGGGPTGLPAVPGNPDNSVQTALPTLPSLQRVTATAVGDSVSISLEPVAGAKDYRVYVLPNDSDVSSTADGHVTVANAIYRCAGNRQSPTVGMDAAPFGQSESVKTLVDGQDVVGFKRSLAEAELGHVFLTPGDGRVPVYALGDPSQRADNSCFHQRWAASRVKKYVSSEQERTRLLGLRWRDDGVAFYVPAAAAEGTKPVYAGGSAETPLYFVDGPEASQRGGTDVAFQILAAAGDADTAPLMRVFYQNGCGNGHDELAAGMPRFERVRTQGDQQPLFDLHWSGLTGETTLVIEALDQGCPFQGLLAPVSRTPSTDDGIDYPAFLTLEDARAASATGEVFINGQHAAANQPRPIARSFVKISPSPKPDLDWYAGFGPDEATPDFAAFTFDAPCGNPLNPGCLAEYRQLSDFADISFTSATKNRNGIGVVLGELWVTYADVGADVGGHFRLTPNTKARMSATDFLHVTMEVDAYTTSRRYPQIFISDGAVPVQWNLTTSSTINLQPFPDVGTGNWPFLFQLQVCDHRNWEVNDQCPSADLYRLGGTGTELSPAPELGELTGVDRATRFDAFLSTKRAYLFAENQPIGCQDLPASGVPVGDVTVTFGDVIYHSGVDSVFSFHEAHQKTVAKRHFDNLGFKSGVPGPTWDETRFPCVSPSAIK